MKELEERNYIFILKAFALYSIVCAHVSFVSLDSNTFNLASGLLLDSLGSIGVGVFLFISGYLFYRNTKSLSTFFTVKIKTIFVPWLFCGTLNFLYVTLRKGGLDFVNWFLAITQHSHLYYLTVLIFSYLIFWKFKNKLWFLTLMSIISIVSIKLTGLGIIKVYPYTNPLNWSIYFAFGLIIKKYNLFEKVVLLSNKYFILVCLIYIAMIFTFIVKGTHISYWNNIPIIAEIVAIIMVFGISTFFIYNNNRVLIKLGEMSFAIYLLHMPFAGIVSNIFNKYNLWPLTLLRPIIVIITTVIGIEIVKLTARKLRIEGKANMLLGLNRFTSSLKV